MYYVNSTILPYLVLQILTGPFSPEDSHDSLCTPSLNHDNLNAMPRTRMRMKSDFHRNCLSLT